LASLRGAADRIVLGSTFPRFTARPIDVDPFVIVPVEEYAARFAVVRTLYQVWRLNHRERNETDIGLDQLPPQQITPTTMVATIAVEPSRPKSDLRNEDLLHECGLADWVVKAVVVRASGCKAQRSTEPSKAA
jgi:hypothetical protein